MTTPLLQKTCLSKFLFTAHFLLLVSLQAYCQQLRPPAAPLITIDPYTSIWSFSDHLYDEPTRHWTDKKQSLTGMIRVDGQMIVFMGKPRLFSIIFASYLCYSSSSFSVKLNPLTF